MCYCWHLMQGWQEPPNFQPLIPPTSLELCGFWPLYLSLQGRGALALDPQIPSICFLGDLHLPVISFLIFNLSFSIGSMKSAFKYIFFHLNNKNKTLHGGISPPALVFLPLHSQTSERVVPISYQPTILPIPHRPVSPQPTLNWLHSFSAAKS